MQTLQFYTLKWFGLFLKYRFFSMKTYPHVTHAIFDLDGTILDTETINSRIYSEILEKFGKKYTDEARFAVTGVNRFDGSRYIVETFQLPITIKEYYALVQEKMSTHLTDPPTKPERLIRHLSATKVPLAIATSSSSESFRIKTKNYSTLIDLFHHVVNGSSDPEVARGKPAPDIFLIAARRFTTPAKPKKCLVFEDSPNGVLGAKAAGMQIVMIPENCPLEKTKEATLVLNSLEEFDPQMFGLPPYSQNKK